MTLTSFRSFRDELQKIAGVSIDAGMRATLAERKGLRMGVEYLPGGELPSNDPSQTGFVPKIAAASELESKAYKKYKKYREPAKATMMGALPGAWVGNLLGPQKMGKNPARLGALIGGGVGIADWVASGRARKWTTAGRRAARREAKLKAVKAKTAMIGSNTFTPGRAMAQSGSVGSFQDKVIHKGSRLKPLKIGQQFDVPSSPTQ